MTVVVTVVVVVVLVVVERVVSGTFVFVFVVVVVVVVGVVTGAFLQHISRSFLQVPLVLSISILVPPICLTSKREPSVMGFTSIRPFSPFTFPSQF